MQSRYKEFPEFNAERFPSIPAGWKDNSWHNDACPSYLVGSFDAIHCVVYIDRANPDEREVSGASRFSVILADNETELGNYESDSWENTLAYIAGAFSHTGN